MHGFARLGEDVRVLGRGEDGVKVGFVEALAGGEDLAGGVGGGEGEFVRGDADDGAEVFVQVDVVGFGFAGVGAPDWVGDAESAAAVVLVGLLFWGVYEDSPFHARLPEARKGPG